MDKDVIISVKGTQTLFNNEKSELELITEGKYYKDGDAYLITYDESEVTGMEGTTTILKVADGVVTLMRCGSINSIFMFQRGQKHISYYDTEYGTFSVGVVTNDLNINVNDNGGEIRVGYQLEFNNNRSGYNDFHMLIREAGNTDDKYNRRYKTGN
ncbi:MAG TPA: DUF1934 domain-containing protein [Clostridiaceae bacterium]|nr:DUF1934 domain-containing protein [Clostridiaceae bacterium]